jgi:RNA polymerase sigma factor (sigma-70 family)
MRANYGLDFVATMTSHRKILLKVARMYGHDEADRQDLVQETMIQLWRSWSSFDGRSQFSTWLYRVALNVAISWSRNEFRRRKRLDSIDDAPAEHLAAPQTTDRSLSDLDMLDRMLRELTELDRALMLLHLEGQEHGVISAVLGISTTNVATKINRIKQRLQTQFSGH